MSKKNMFLANGRYQTREAIGSRGGGNVHLANDMDASKDVAVKIVSPELAMDKGFMARFGRELNILKSIKHPHVVRYLDFGNDNSLFYIVMEPVYGADGEFRNIRDLMDENGGKVEPEAAIRIMEQALVGLEHVHDNDIIHRSIKPSNLLVGPLDRVVISDFGFASSYPAKQIETLHLKDSIPYMSPEQRRDPVSVTKASDIFAMGVLFYELLTGQMPSAKEFKKPHTLIEGLDERYSAVIMKAMKRQPEQRFAGAKQMRRAITDIRDTKKPIRKSTFKESAKKKSKPNQRKEIDPDRFAKLVVVGFCLLMAVLFTVSQFGDDTSLDSDEQTSSDNTTEPKVKEEQEQEVRQAVDELKPDEIVEYPRVRWHEFMSSVFNYTWSARVNNRHGVPVGGRFQVKFRPSPANQCIIIDSTSKSDTTSLKFEYVQDDKVGSMELTNLGRNVLQIERQGGYLEEPKYQGPIRLSSDINDRFEWLIEDYTVLFTKLY